MRILFLGNANNPLLINLALELRKLNHGFTIDILSEVPVIHHEASAAFNAVFALPAGKGYRGIPLVETVWITTQFRKTLKGIGSRYDVVHMFDLHVGYTRCMQLIHDIASRFVLTIRGNELSGFSELILKELEPLILMADHVTADNLQVLSAFCKRFPIDESKTSICRFGLTLLDEISEQKSDGLAEHKAACRLPENSFVIACGTSASSDQQHEAIIDSLASVKNKLPDNYLLVLPVVTGGTSRKQLIRTKLTAQGLKFVFIEKYLSNDQLAHLRAASDVMIHVPSGDQFAGSMQEHLAAGSIVVTGDWLLSSVYEDHGVQYWKVSNPSLVGGKVVELLGDLSRNRARVRGNMERILLLSSWRKNVHEWYKLYHLQR